MTRKTFSDLVEQGAQARRNAAAAEGAQRTRTPPRGGLVSPPALTGGETSAMRGGAKVDWMTCTWLPDPDEWVPGSVRDMLTSVIGPVTGVEAPGMFGYEQGLKFFVTLADGVQHHVARLDWGGNHHKCRARLDMSGSACSKVMDWSPVADWIGRLWDHTLTRVDLAVDCLAGEFDVEDARDWYLSGEFHAGGRRPRHSLVGDWLDPAYGRTMEIGRRCNGKMLRAYEKGRQLGDTSSPWTRWEVELRNIDRDLPLDVLTRCDEYFVGAYRCLERILDAAAERIPTAQAEGEIALAHLVHHAREAYGRVVHTLRLNLDASELLDFISRPGIPKRLEKASLAGFTAAHSPAAFLREEQSHESPSRGF